MSNLFGTDEMAAGYAWWRPPVHPLVMERVWRALKRGKPYGRALDVGCGAGLSTKVLHGFAEHAIGLEPVEAMLRWTSYIAPWADFLVGRAEALPLRDRSVDLMTAAGSLNYTSDLDRFWLEARRVLNPGGVLVVYDFSAGRRFRDDPALDDWFAVFEQRYPASRSEARPLSPEILAGIATGFNVGCAQSFEIGLTLKPGFYLDYMLTETNVAAAVRNGTPYGEIRAWCEETLAPVWGGRKREVIFLGYFACMTPA